MPKSKKAPPAPLKPKPGRTRVNGGRGKQNGWLTTLPTTGHNGGGNPKLVLTKEAIEHVCDRLFGGEALSAIIDDMGIKHRVFWARMRDTPDMADAIDGAFEGVMTYDIQVSGKEIVQKAFDRDSAAAADVKLKELHKRVEMMARQRYGRDAGKNSVAVSVAAVVVPQKDTPGVPQIGVLIEHGESQPKPLSGAFRLMRKD